MGRAAAALRISRDTGRHLGAGLKAALWSAQRTLRYCVPHSGPYATEGGAAVRTADPTGAAKT